MNKDRIFLKLYFQSSYDFEVILAFPALDTNMCLNTIKPVIQDLNDSIRFIGWTSQEIDALTYSIISAYQRLKKYNLSKVNNEFSLKLQYSETFFNFRIYIKRIKHKE